jgi:hypothetical protein
MSRHDARPEAALPRQAVYAEDRPGLRWPLVATTILGWILMAGGAIGAALPHLGGLAVLAVAGAFLALIGTIYLLYSMAVGVRVYEDSIQIGGLRGRDRRLQRGTWPPRKLPAGSRKAVFTCPWQATDDLYLELHR